MSRWTGYTAARARTARVRGLAVLAAFLVVATAASACSSPAGTGPVTAAAATGPTSRFAPYLDVTAPRPPLVELSRATGDTTFVLAFVLAGPGGCDPRWDGRTAIDDPGLVSEVTALRAAGGDVVVATGGALGTYLENACTSADALAVAYGKALDAVGSHRLDVDIEQSVPVDMVNMALLTLRRSRKVEVSFTLRVANQTDGLDRESVQLLRSAARLGMTATVNAMVMNFPYTGSWSLAMVEAAESSSRQIRSAWPDMTEQEAYQALGLIVMIGRNDSGMTTTTADVRTVLGFAATHSVGRLGFWSIARDNGGCPEKKVATNNCSGVPQSPYEFNGMFRGIPS